jgi:hypothetical protein
LEGEVGEFFNAMTVVGMLFTALLAVAVALVIIDLIDRMLITNQGLR